MGYACIGAIEYPGYNGIPRPHEIWVLTGPGRAAESWELTRAKYFPDYRGPPPRDIALVDLAYRPKASRETPAQPLPEASTLSASPPPPLAKTVATAAVTAARKRSPRLGRGAYG